MKCASGVNMEKITYEAILGETASTFNTVWDFFIIIIIIIIVGGFDLFNDYRLISITFEVKEEPSALGFKLGVLFGFGFARNSRRLCFTLVWQDVKCLLVRKNKIGGCIERVVRM
jgi:hypothetical protein